MNEMRDRPLIAGEVLPSAVPGGFRVSGYVLSFVFSGDEFWGQGTTLESSGPAALCWLSSCL
jgi:hypothetical protein